MPRRAVAESRARTALLGPSRPVEVAVAAPDLAASVSLRALRASDRDEFVRVVRLSREHMDRWLPLHRPGESDEALFERQLEMTKRGDAEFTAHRRVAVVPGPAGRERLVGAFNLITVTRGLELSGDINWWVASDALGQGVGLRGGRLLIAHAFGDPPAGLGLHMLRGYIQRDNAACIRLAAKLGMVRREDGRSHIQTGERWVVHDLYTIASPAA